MAWKSGSAAALRNRNEKERQEKTVMATAAGGAEPLSQRKSADSRNPLDLGSTGKSWAKGSAAALRAQKQQEATSRQTGTDLYSTALEDYRTRNNLGFADAMDSRSDELNRQKVTVSPAGNTLGTWYGQQAQKLKNSYAEYSQPEAFDQANQWFDQPRNQELVNKLLEKKSNYTSYAETGTSRNGASAGDGSIDPFRTTGIKGKVGNTYSTADLKKLGYTDTEIRQAREYLDTMEEIPEWKQLARRTANTVGSVADTVAAAPLMGAEYLVQAGKNIRQSSENRKALEAELARNPREKNLYDQLMETDMDYQPKYSTGDLLQQGFTRQEIEDMRSRIAGTEAKGGIDTEKSVGYQLYNRGQQLTGAAQSGLTDVQRTVQGVATSAAENLAVAAINPAAVLPVLSAQGAADAMGKSAAKGESAGKALAGGVAKFGAGWAINSVGAADLARTMGADYARNSVAGAVADKIRALAGDSAFAAAHPAVANAISGGIDNAVQAFVETYADKAIDAALGDSEAAQTMFTTDTLVQALEAGLSGGASGALGGAVGTGLSRMNAGDSSLRGNVERYAAQDEYEQALKEHQRREELAREPEPLSQRVSADSPPNRATTTTAASGGNREELLGQRPAGYERSEVDAGSRNPLAKLTLQAQTETAANQAAEGNSAETAAISDNLAVQTFAEAAAGDSLTGKTIRLFTPEAGNEANRAAFEEAYGVKLPSTAAATRRMLREVAAQRSQQNAVENAGESVESPTETAADGAEPLSHRISADSRNPLALGSAENTGLTAQNGADRQAVMQSVPVEESTLDGMDNSNSPMRETYGMEAPRTEGQKQARTEQVLRSWKVGEKAAQEISRKQPEGVDSDRYAAAASTLYRLGQMEDVKTFDQALELAGTGSGMAANVNYVLGNLKGRNALEIAYTYGRDAADTRWAKSQLGGTLTEQSLTGRGETIYKGTLRNANDAGSQVIELNAAATGTTAVLKNVLQNGAGQADSRVRAYVDTETGRIFFGDSANDVFGTVLHEDYHWYNALDSEGAKALQDHALLYLARSSGFETVDEMIREKMTDYAQQNLTYEEAAEELVGDAWRGIFSNESDFKRWVEFQRGQAEKNSGRAGTIRTVMNRVKEMLGGIISRAKEVLTLDPDNRAALKAQRLAENERRILQDEYFAHAEKAMDNLRSAKENAAAPKTESAAEGQGVRYSINPSYAQDIDEWNRDGRNSREIFVLGSTAEALQGLGARENDIYMKGDKISLILEQHPEMTLNEIKRIPEILDDPILVLSSQNKGRAGSQNTRLVLFGSVKAQDGRPVLCVLDLQPVENRIVIQDMQKATSAYTKDNDPVRFVRNSEVLYTSENKKRTTALLRTLGFQMPSELQRYGSMGSISYHGQNVKMEGVPFTKIEPFGKAHMESEDSGSRGSEGSIYQESADTVLKTEEGGERPSFPAKNSIAQENAESKKNSEPVKKSVRFQLSAPVEVDQNKDLVAVHNLTAENLQEALELGGMPSPSIAVVKAQEGHTKYGPISLVFNSDTIDPMVNRANRIYGSDAWTPTRPNVEYKVKPDKARALNTELAELSRKTAGGEFARSNAITGIMDMEASDKSPKQLAEKLAQNPSVKAAYLADIGETVDVAMKQEERFTASQVRRSEKTIEAVGGEEALRNIIETDRANDNHDLAHTVLEKVREAEKDWAMEEFGWSEEKAQKKAERVIPPKLLILLNNAYDYMVTEDKGGKLVRDTDAMLKKVQEKAPDQDVEEWILPKVEKILGEKGIYNGKEVYTRNGNRRSFAQLHNSYTLENLVAAMNAQNARGQGTWGLSASTLMSTATAEYQNLDEVRADKGRLQQMPEEEYKALLEKADDQISDILDKLRRETTPHADNSFEEREILGGILMQAAQGKQTAAAIGKTFAKEGYTIGKDTAQMILNLYKNVAAIPTGYFEAKPQRAVGFDEVRAAILPDNTSSTLIDSLKETGIDVKLYKAGDDAQRTALLNKVPNVRFQLAEQAERDARKNTQRQASRAIADNSAAMETLAQMMGVTHGVRISQDSIDGLAVRWTKANGSRADRTKIAGETRALVEYMTADGASMSKASALSETIADEILSGATYRNTELWDEYPEYHDLSYTVNKDGPAKAELVKRYGTWSEAVAEARRHGVKLRQAEGVRDGNPAEVYEAIVNDTRAMGGTKQGAAELFRGAAKAAGVDGAASMESTEWLDVLMNVHDAIKPRMMSRFADAAEYEDAKVELADRMLGDILSVPEMTDAQAIFDGLQRWQRQAVAAAVGEENAEQALKDLRKVQKEQNREFNRRMYENSRNGSRDEALRQWTEQQKRNEKAEKLLDQNLDTLGLDITNYGDMAEKLDVLKEAYEREWKAEKKRLKEERQQMLDEIRLENKQLKRENWNLSHQVAGEQRRADRAEWQLIHQENELLEWEQENQRKAQEWQEKQAERNAIAITAAQQQRDEDIAIAKKLAEKRVQKARDGRQKDELKRAIRNNATQLNQMVLRPAKDKYVQPRLILRALEVAKLADMTLLNQNAVNRLDALANSIRAEYGDADHPVVTEMSNDWEQSGIANLIDALKADLNASKQAQLDRLNQQLTEAEALPDSEKAEMLRDRLRKRIRETENRTYLPMTVDQMRMLKAITTSTLHVIRTANKTLSLQQAEAVDKIANEAAAEVRQSKGNDGKLRSALTRYNLDMLGAARVFRMLGGYAKNSQMEKLGTMLNDGQREQTRITVEGTKLFDNVTGKANLRQMEKFAGPGAELVDIGLKDSKGRAAPLTHAQLCSLYMHLQNADSREHLLNGGLTIPDAEEYNRGDIEKAYQKGQTVRIGMLTDSEGKPMADTVIQAVEKAMTDYDRAWCEDMKQFFGSYTTNLINETSMKLLGYQRATVKSYYPIAVDKTALATQIEGVKLDATIEGRGFLKNRVKSQMPILLEECSSVVQRSLRDTAAYAGLAAPIRDVQKVLNSGIETEDGIKMLKNGILKEQWGQSATNYIDDLLTDLQTTQRKRSTTMTKVLDRLRGNYAGAILTLNPGVAIAQAASLPTAGAVLGADTMAAVVPFVKNLSGKQRAALEAEIAQHGDVLLRYRLRGSQRGELASIGVSQGMAEKAMDKLPKWVTGWINSMDEITVAALWEGSKRYVEHHTNEFAEGAATKGSEAYWEAVNKMYQRVIEETQPNYTTMQRAGIQRSDNELVRTLTMFTTQRFQNYGILADAVLAYNAKWERSHADPTEENRAELKRAGKNLNRAVTSQIVQTAVFAAMKIGADFLLHRWDREQDENGDITAWSLLKRYADLYVGSAAGTFLYGSELYSFVGNVAGGKDYDVVSAPNLSAINDLGTEAMRLYKLLATDTGEMDEEELEAYHEKLRKAALTFMEDGMELKGLPAGNAEKLLEAAWKWSGNAAYAVTGGKYGEKLSLNSLPASATGQYDRLYNAIAEGDTDNASGAMAKLEAMGKDEKTIASQLKNRLKKYSPEVEQAARARNEGKDSQRQELTKQLVREMYETLGIREGVKADAKKRAWVIDLVIEAIESKAEELYRGGTGGSVYDALTEAVDTGRADDVQDEVKRLRTAGKEDGSIKTKITAAVKEEYLAGNDHDREKLEKLLTSLTKEDGTAMYEEKNFAQWVKDAAKKEEQEKNSKDEWAGVR
ncbi:hypothetical protein [Faecalibacterium hominis (ex Afrizal et al. 2022)]|uniref:MuF-C-terminal domain-containing protein n=1 Tax=Faecalibacterium hominis (ex Afrizal et al. 2022) TaxID=2881265 RepID=UPI003C2DBF70